LSTVLLIDGYNLIGPVAAPRSFVSSRQRASGNPAPRSWLQVERQKLLERLSEHLGDLVRERTCVVFDAKNAPRGRSSEGSYQSIQVRYAVDYPEADDLLEEIIRNHPAPKHLSVISSDHRVQAAARRRKAAYFDADPWYDDLVDGKLILGWHPKRRRRQADRKQTDDPKLVDNAPQSDGSAGRGRSRKTDGPGLPDELEIGLSDLLGGHREPSAIELSDEELRRWIDGVDE
jgi:predicted RNA-binding protein with PIN domain